MESEELEKSEIIRKEQQAEHFQRLQDIMELLKAPAGVRFLKRIFDHAQIYNDVFTGNSQTFHTLGFQKFGRLLSEDLREIFDTANPVIKEKIAYIMLSRSSTG